MRISPGPAGLAAARDHPMLLPQPDFHAPNQLFLGVNPRLAADVVVLVLDHQALLAAGCLGLAQHPGVDPDDLRARREQGAALERIEEIATPATTRAQPADAFEG